MGTHPRTLTLAVFNMVAALHVGVCHTNKAQSLTVLGGSVSKHHPQVAAAHVFNGNRHLARTRKKKVLELGNVLIQDYAYGTNAVGRFTYSAFNQCSPNRLLYKLSHSKSILKRNLIR